MAFLLLVSPKSFTHILNLKVVFLIHKPDSSRYSNPLTSLSPSQLGFPVLGTSSFLLPFTSLTSSLDLQLSVSYHLLQVPFLNSWSGHLLHHPVVYNFLLVCLCSNQRLCPHTTEFPQSCQVPGTLQALIFVEWISWRVQVSHSQMPTETRK